MENQENKILKQFSASTFAVKNRTTVYVLTAMILIFGAISYNSLPKENFPDVSVPTVFVGTPYPGNSPVEIEQLITRVLEKELKTEEGIEEISSNSVDGFSSITVEFDMDVDTDDAVFRVKNAIDRASSYLPSDLPEDPLVKEIDMSEIAILNVSFAGPYTVSELRAFAETLKDEVERFPAVSEGQIKGIDDREVHINIDPYEMDARNITFSDIKNAVANEHINISGGDIISNGMRRSVRVIGEFADPTKIENVVIKVEAGKPVYLRDIGSVDYTFIDKESYSRVNGKETVTLDIIKRSGYNILSTTEEMANIVADMQESTFPKDLVITLTNDQSKRTRDSLRELENNIITGMLLVIIVLLFFMNTRNAMFVGLAIPMSMFLSFLIMSFFGITLNTMVLFGLVMALGMLVDNGIVLVENVYRLAREGYTPVQATIYGVGEIAWPIIASTATTVAAFLPLAMWPGMMGEFFKNLPITIAIVLSSSLFVALVINPTFLAYFMKEEDDEKEPVVNHKRVILTGGSLVAVGIVMLIAGKNVPGNLLGIFGTLVILDTYVLSPLAGKFQRNVLPRLENAYGKMITFALRGNNPFWFLGSTVAMLFVSLFLFRIFQPQVLFFPMNIPTNVYVMAEYPIGTDLSKTIETTVELENKVYETLGDDLKYVKSIVTSCGTGSSDPNAEIKAKGAGTFHEGIVKVEFVDFEDRIGVDTYAIMGRIRAAIADRPGVLIKVDKNRVGPPVGKAIQIEVSGYDFDGLIATGNSLIESIKTSGIEGIETLASDLELTKPEYQIMIDREKAAFFGLSTAQIGDEIRTAIFGKIVGKYKDRNDDWDIKVRFTEDYRYNAEALKNKILTLKNNQGEVVQIPVSAVADFQLGSTFGMINRKQQQRVLTISSNVLPGYNATAVNNQIQALLPTLDIPTGYYVSFGGEQKEQGEEMAFLMQAFVFAIFLIFAIIVLQFNKISAPLIIMGSIVLSTIGVFLGLIMFEMDFVVMMTMMGIISLAGVVVNNAIVLIDFADVKKIELMMNLKEGEVVTKKILADTIAEAGKTRLIPVLLTAITTILGLLPMAIGMNIDFVQFVQNYNLNFYTGAESQAFWGPLAWTVIFGLTFATFLTLVIVPVMVLLIDRMKLRAGKDVAKIIEA